MRSAWAYLQAVGRHGHDAQAAPALRPLLYPDGPIVMVGFGVVAVAASVYLVYVLEIVKFRRFRERQLGKQEGMTQAEIDEEIDREIETGEFPAVKLDS